MRKPLSLYHPWLYALRVWQRRLARALYWRLSSRRLGRVADARLPYRYIRHTSKLIRRLGDSDLALQHNKVINLRLAVACMDGVVIGPGSISPSASCSAVPRHGAGSSRAWSCRSARRVPALAAGCAS